MAYEPLHHKYRPQTFADLVGQEAIATTLTNALLSERIAPAYLFTGPRGTGKTSSARILAKSLNCMAGPKPTPTPCGVCETCRSIIRGSALDVIEIDAASNTGVDNIREIIERSQFAPVQCRFKVYVIDECLKGDSLVLTRNGLMRIDDVNIKDQEVLSYNETSSTWEYKKVLRWLEQGKKETLVIKTSRSTLCCTGNHLIRTDQGWLKAQNLTPGMKILSPASVDADNSSKNTELMAAHVALPGDTNFVEITTDKKPTISRSFSNKQNNYVPSVFVDVERNLIFPPSCKLKVEELRVLNPIGKDIPTKKGMELGKREQLKLWPMQTPWGVSFSALSMVPSSAMAALTIPTKIAVSPDCDGHMGKSNKHGSNIKLSIWPFCPQNSVLQPIKATEQRPSVVKQFAIPNSSLSLGQSNLTQNTNKSPKIGLNKSRPKVWAGGIWTTAPFPFQHQVLHLFNCTQKDFPTKKINLLPNGLQGLATQQPQNLIQEVPLEKPIIISEWEQKPPENGYQTCDNMQSLQWHTSFEIVESIITGDIEKVYDIEVENNHNFVANGLLVHNCHMLSTAAFNALLKTLEEPPESVIFVLATTDPQRVLPTIISRCQRFDYRRIPLASMVSHLRKIADLENINIDQDAITLVAQLSNGGLRDAESLLDQLSLLSGTISPEKVWDLVGAVPEQDLLALLNAIASDNSETVIDCCRQLMNRGREPLVVLQNLAAFYLNLLIAKNAPKRADLIAVTAQTWEILCQMAAGWETTTILMGQQKLKESEFQLRNSTQPRLWLEVTLLGLLPSACQTIITDKNVSRTITNPIPISLPSKSQHSTVINAVEKEAIAAQGTNSEVSPVKENVGLSGEEVWEKVLQELTPMTQSLLHDHGNLQKFDNHTAQISIKTEALLKIVKPKQPELEKAFEKICGQTIRVTLISATANTPPPAASPPISQPPPTSPSPTTFPSPPTSPFSNTSPSPPSSPSSRNGHQLPKPVTVTPPIPTVQPEEIPTSISDDDITKAAKQLVKAFDGEIVDLTSTEDEENPTEETAIASSPEPVKQAIIGRPIILNVDEDEDIPFLRPVYSKSSLQFEMLDHWETSINAYWQGIGQFLS